MSLSRILNDEPLPALIHRPRLKLAVPHAQEGTITDLLKRALAEWITFRQKSNSSAQHIVDEIQGLLDSHEGDDQGFRKIHVGLLRFLYKFYPHRSTCPTSSEREEPRSPAVDVRSVESLKGWISDHQLHLQQDIWRGTLEGKPVCLKVLRIFVEQDLKARDIIRKEFCHEALIWRQLRHPNILPLLGVSIDLFSPSFCLVSPWMENKDIITYLKQNPEHNIHVVLSEVASGLRYMHSLALVHGDLKGANILVTDDRRCCLADFGLSVITSSSQSWTMTTSSNFAGKGTIRWLAPEYLTSEIPNRPPRDIYAFGCTILEIFTKKPPFSDRKNEIALMSYVMGGGRPERPRDFRYSDAIWDLITLCWAQNVEERPSANQICETLNRQELVNSQLSHPPTNGSGCGGRGTPLGPSQQHPGSQKLSPRVPPQITSYRSPSMPLNPPPTTAKISKPVNGPAPAATRAASALTPIATSPPTPEYLESPPKHKIPKASRKPPTSSTKINATPPLESTQAPALSTNGIKRPREDDPEAVQQIPGSSSTTSFGSLSTINEPFTKRPKRIWEAEFFELPSFPTEEESRSRIGAPDLISSSANSSLEPQVECIDLDQSEYWRQMFSDMGWNAHGVGMTLCSSPSY